MEVMTLGCKRCLNIVFNDGLSGMSNIKNLFRNLSSFFSISAFTCFKQIEEKITKKLSHYK